MQRLGALLILVLGWSFGACGKAGPIIYNVTIDTSSEIGISGSLDFNFDPGPLVTQAASLQVVNFTSAGTLTDCAANLQGFCPTGEVSGLLPGSLTFDNGASLNDYFDGFTFGTTISFEISLYGPALTMPDGVSTSGSTFAFSMFSDPAGTMPALTTDTNDGFAFTVGVNLDGTTTLTNFSAEATLSAVPEPSSRLLLLIGLVCLFWRSVSWRPAYVPDEGVVRGYRRPK